MAHQFILGDSAIALRDFPANSFDACFTSPPYFGLIDYESPAQIGLECSLTEYLTKLSQVFTEVFRVLKPGSCCWVVMGDSMANFSPVRTPDQRRSRKSGNWSARRSPVENFRQKEVYGVPFKFAEIMRQIGWLHRSTLIWDKQRCGSIGRGRDGIPATHEYVLMFVKHLGRSRCYANFDATGINESVIRINNERWSKTAHGASLKNHPCPFPAALPHLFLSRLRRSSCCSALRVLDPFCGSGTTMMVADDLGLDAVGIDVRDWDLVPKDGDRSLNLNTGDLP